MRLEPDEGMLEENARRKTQSTEASRACADREAEPANEKKMMEIEREKEMLCTTLFFECVIK